MFKNSPEFEELIQRIEEVQAGDIFARIRCPECEWRPERSSRWTCFDPSGTEHPTGGCLKEWNTFDTYGVCPGCSHQWMRTTCLRCHVHSLHEDWYEEADI